MKTQLLVALALVVSSVTAQAYQYDAVRARAASLYHHFRHFHEYSYAVPQGPYFQSLNASGQTSLEMTSSLWRLASSESPSIKDVQSSCASLSGQLNSWLAIYAQGEHILAAEHKVQYHNVYIVGAGLKVSIAAMIDTCSTL